jgi:hypothetical protein
MIAIQQAIEWLQPFLFIVLVSRVRPIDKTLSGKSKSKRNRDEDSSDEGKGGNRGGFGSHFRSRQLNSLLCFLFPKSKSSDLNYDFILLVLEMVQNWFKILSLETARRDGPLCILCE